MATRVEFERFDYRRAVEGEIANSDGVGSALAGMADKAASVARGVAPVRTGAYLRSISSRRERGASGYGASVSASVPYAPFIEFGSPTTHVYAPIRRGVEAATRGPLA
jgi:hypothetical protein